MSDVIYRKDVLNLIPQDVSDFEEGSCLAYDVGRLPSAQRKGRWLEVSGYATPGGDPVWACSECGKGLHTYGIEHSSYGTHIADGQWVACPNCGADMRGEEN